MDGNNISSVPTMPLMNAVQTTYMPQSANVMNGNMQQMNEPPAAFATDQNELIHLLRVLQKYNLKDSEDMIRRELRRLTPEAMATSKIPPSVVEKVIQESTNKERDYYFDTYESLVKFVESIKSENKHELSQILYPIFMYLYFEIINKDLSALASEFFEKFSPYHKNLHAVDLKRMKVITNKDQYQRTDYKEIFGSIDRKYNVKLSDESYRFLKEYVKSKNSKQLVDLIKENMLLEIYNGPLRDSKQQAVSGGGVLGEANTNKNTNKLFYGILKEPEHFEENDEDDEGGDKPKKRKNRKDALLKNKNRQDPNAPPPNRVPLPELREVDRQNRRQINADLQKRARLGPDKPPSICFYTLLNTYNTVNCCDISDDSSWLALGLSDSTVRICTLTKAKKLQTLKSINELELLDKESDDIFEQLYDETSGTESRTLVGHSAPVFAVSFSPDKTFVLSGSEDASIRLWCLLTYSCLLSYKGHNSPVWDVKFGPYGHYFASAAMDKTARVWAIDQYQAIRMYADHQSDVECICFHPNCNYLATGSSDRNVRVFDLALQQDNPQVRLFTGHKDAICVMKFSNCGRYLASGGADAAVIVWDISTSIVVAHLNSHRDAVYSIDFSRDNTVFATGGLDNTIKLWNMTKLNKEIDQNEDANTFVARNESQLEIGSWRTKQTPIMQLHFTRRNLLLGIGAFQSS